MTDAIVQLMIKHRKTRAETTMSYIVKHNCRFLGQLLSAGSGEICGAISLFDGIFFLKKILGNYGRTTCPLTVHSQDFHIISKSMPHAFWVSK
jgi:hypothetical protein